MTSSTLLERRYRAVGEVACQDCKVAISGQHWSDKSGGTRWCDVCGAQANAIYAAQQAPAHAADNIGSALASALKEILDFPSRQEISDIVAGMIAESAPLQFQVRKPDGSEAGRVDGPQHPRFSALLAAVIAGERVWIYGPSGTGKTYAATLLAKALGVPCYIVSVRVDESQVRGIPLLSGGFTVTPFRQWAKDQPGLLILDEIDRWERSALIALNAVLEQGYCEWADGTTDQITREHRVVACANTNGLGADSDYTAAQRQDLSIIDRFPVSIHWPIDEKHERLVCQQFGSELGWVRWAQSARKALAGTGHKSYWSPRHTYSYCRMRKSGIGHAEACASIGVLARLPPDVRTKILADAGAPPEAQ